MCVCVCASVHVAVCVHVCIYVHVSEYIYCVYVYIKYRNLEIPRMRMRFPNSLSVTISFLLSSSIPVSPPSFMTTDIIAFPLSLPYIDASLSHTMYISGNKR